ncbi:MAG: transcription elongation factor GreA [Chloroflexi bacterium]|nr:transcription elongation factor GreA [Chloroflexota bacterium]
MAEQVHFLTANGKAKLEQELEYLLTVRRHEVAESLKAAVEEGDLTENAGYEETKREQAFIEGRIQELESILFSAQVLTEPSTACCVSLGVSVTVSEEGYPPETYQIVGRAEADPLKGRISNESPLGKALLGKHIGDQVAVVTPGGTTTFTILQIS